MLASRRQPAARAPAKLPVPVSTGTVAVFVRVCVFGFGWMVVRFVRVIRLPACARVFRVCPGSPRCLFTGTVPASTYVRHAIVNPSHKDTLFLRKHFPTLARIL